MSRPRYSALCALGLAALLALTGCFGRPTSAPTNSATTPTASATPTAAPTPTATPTPSPTPSPTTVAPPSPTPTQPPATRQPTVPGLPEQTAPLTIYYVAVGDNGVSGPAIGCGDSLIATTTAPVRFTDQVGPSIRALLANKSRDVGQSGLVNVLYRSDLGYLGGQLTGSTITIWLSGHFMLAGMCDIPRAKAQLEYTAMAASGATSAQVFINGRPIDEVLSLK